MSVNPRRYIRGSDGTGEAVRAFIIEAREVGDMSLITDSVLNMPHDFIGTTGTLDPTSGLVDESTQTVFFGHLDGSIVMIDEFAPGYFDTGNTIDQVLLLKPTTAWADSVADSIKNTIVVSPTAPPDPIDGDFWMDTSAPEPTIGNLAKDIGNILMPVGFIYTNKTDSTNPGTKFGFGTWVAISDRFIYAQGTKAAGATGGAETHTLSVAELPNISGSFGIHGQENGTMIAGLTGYTTGSAFVGKYGNLNYYAGSVSYTAPGFNFGSGGAHNNMPPYVVAYMWERTA